MSVQDHDTQITPEQLVDPALPLDDDVEAHGAKEWIAGLSTAVVLTGAGAGVAAASMGSFSPDPRGTAHAAVDTAFDTSEQAGSTATGAAENAQQQAYATADYATAFANSTREAARDRVDDTLDAVDDLADDAFATIDSLSAPLREMVQDIIENRGDVNTTTRVVSTLPRSFAGQAVTLSASVLPGEARTSTVGGRVTFLDGNTKLGSVMLSTGGVATFTTSDLKAGDHAIRAVYHGNETYKGSVSPRAEQDVDKAATATVVTSSASRDGENTVVRLVATVASAHPGLLPATGSVTFWSADTKLGVGRIGPDGTASITTSALGEGLHDVVAQYAGDARHAASESLPLPQVVTEAPSASIGTDDGEVTVSVSAAGYGTSISVGPKTGL
jgi:hypothetical protein